MRLILHNLTIQYSDRIVFSQASKSIPLERVTGLIGNNGSGKTTLLKMISDKTLPDSGKVTIEPKSARIRYISGFIPEQSTSLTIEEYVLREYGLFGLYQSIKKSSPISNSPKEYLDLYNQFFNIGGFDILQNIPEALTTLGLAHFDPTALLESLSSGERNKVSLISLFLQSNDIFLLDEPTSNLDFESISLLEEIISSSQSSFLIASHDRMLLDSLCTQILEISNQSIQSFQGNYSSYLEQKESVQNIQKLRYESAIKHVKKLKRTVSQKSSQAQSTHHAVVSVGVDGGTAPFIRKKAGKKSRIAKILKERLQKKLLQFQTDKFIPDKDIIIKPTKSKKESGIICDMQNVSFEYESRKMVLKGINLIISAHEKVLLLGENGTGKSTLLKLISKKLSPTSGTVIIPPQCSIGYFPFTLTSQDLQSTVISFFQHYTHLKEHICRTIIHGLLFSQRQVDQAISLLSTGERAKLQLAALFYGSYDLILLDEPTTFLDIASTQVIESIIHKSESALILTSHDRWFVNSISIEKVLRVRDKNLVTTSRHF